MNNMCVAVDERRGQNASVAIQLRRVAKPGIDIVGAPNPSDPVSVNQHGPVAKQAISAVLRIHPGDGYICNQQTVGHSSSLNLNALNDIL